MENKNNVLKKVLSPAMDRRAFLQKSAGITFIIGSSGLISACSSDDTEQLSVPVVTTTPVADASSQSLQANIWVTINPDDSIIVKYAGTEMGQGSMTHTPLILAEFLEANWDKVEVEIVTVHDEAYGNPLFRNILYTAGSTNVMVYFDKMKLAGVQTKKMLLQAVADDWSVPINELSAESSVVSHIVSGRNISYGEIVASMQLPSAVPEVDESEYKSKSEYRYLGKQIMRRDVPAKSNGTAEYGMDVQVPGMSYAAMLRTPVEGEHPVEVDDAEAKKVKGVTDIVVLAYGVAVVGDTVEATQWGKQKLKVKWSEESPFRKANSDAAIADYTTMARDLSISGPVWNEKGDVRDALARAKDVVEALYTTEPVYHAQMEPLNATASVSEDGKSAEIWVGTQTQSLTIIGSAETLGTTNDKITLHPLTMGGGYGRRSTLHQQYIDDALLVSRELKRPVKVIWSREDDIESGLFRPTAAQYLRAGFDADGKLIGLHHRVATPEILPTMNKLRWEWAKPKDVISMLGSENTTYDIPNHQAEHVVTERVSRVLAWRGVATSYTKFAMESFIDELALSRGIDPLEYRLQLCHQNPRMTNILNELAEMAEWSRPRDNGTALGLAISGYARSLSAGIVELSVDEKSGKINIHKFWGVGDPGFVVSPRNATAQMEGNLIFGLSAALMERISIKNGVVQQSNFHDYPIMRMQEVPDIETKVLSTENPSSGVGELGLAMVAPAIANGIATLTGKRVRHLPLTPDVVLKVLTA